MKAEILPPLAASVHVKPAGWRRGVRLWLPLFLLWLLLIPLLLLALPFLFLAALVFGFRLLRAVPSILALLAAFRRTEVEVEKPSTRVFIKLH
jgi:hypothetical protein